MRRRLITVELAGQTFRISRDDAKLLMGRMGAQMRDVYGAGPGRPKLEDRCPCGVMTTDRAAKRGHKCERGAR